MGTPFSRHAPDRPALSWSHLACSLVLLWRSTILSLVKAATSSTQTVNLAATKRLFIMTLLMLSSRSTLWRFIRRYTSLTLTWQRALILSVLQLYGDVVPVIIILISVASSLLRWFDSVYTGALKSIMASGIISASMMFFLHELPGAIAPSYLKFLRVVSGKSVPVMTLPKVFDRLRPDEWTAVTKALVGAETGMAWKVVQAFTHAAHLPSYARFCLRSYMHTFRSFLILYVVMRPLFKLKLPSWHAVYQAARTAFWVSLAGSIGYLAGKIHLAGHPVLTTAIRLTMGFFGAACALIEEPGLRRSIVAFMGAQALFACMKVGERTLKLQDGVFERFVSVLYPLCSLFGCVESSSLTDVLIKTI